MRDPRAVPTLISALNDRDQLVYTTVEYALAHIGAPAVPTLITSLKDSDATLRSRTASVLGEIRDTRAVEPLIDLLGDQILKVLQCAKTLLCRILNKDLGYDADTWRKYWKSTEGRMKDE